MSRVPRFLSCFIPQTELALGVLASSIKDWFLVARLSAPFPWPPVASRGLPLCGFLVARLSAPFPWPPVASRCLPLVLLKIFRRCARLLFFPFLLKLPLRYPAPGGPSEARPLRRPVMLESVRAEPGLNHPLIFPLLY